jgi:hypothetical protein
MITGVFSLRPDCLKIYKQLLFPVYHKDVCFLRQKSNKNVNKFIVSWFWINRPGVFNKQNTKEVTLSSIFRQKKIVEFLKTSKLSIY